MSRRTRLLLAVALLLFVSVALVRYFSTHGLEWKLLNVAGNILLFALPKGALLRFMGGSRPYRSALVANAFSEVSSLGFPVSWLGLPWPALGASLILSTGIETVALMAMGTSKAAGCFLMALYINVFAHMVLAGAFLWETGPWAGGAVFFASFVVFILPIFIVERHDAGRGTSQEGCDK